MKGRNMVKKKAPDDDGDKRVTVVFNAKDYAAIERELKRREKVRGYPVTVSEVLRELVREQWGA
jgi:hypothetical protein